MRAPVEGSSAIVHYKNSILLREWQAARGVELLADSEYLQMRLWQHVPIVGSTRGKENCFPSKGIPMNSAKTFCRMLETVLAGASLVTLPAGNAHAQPMETPFDQYWFQFQRRPTLSLLYGPVTSSIDGLGGKFAQTAMAELKIGGSRQDSLWDCGLIESLYEYLTIANVSDKLAGASAQGEIRTDSWRLGATWQKGYGYILWDADFRPELILYKADGILWSKTRVTDLQAGTPDGDILSRFDNAFRFGTKMESGMSLRLIPIAELDVSYERAVVFRRHVFWPWVGSVLAEGAGQWLIDCFVDKVIDSSPGAAPVVNFALKNGLAFAAYQLRKQNAFAPFDGESPLFAEGFKFGVTLVF